MLVPFDPQIVSATSLDFNNNSTNNPTAGPWTITLPARSVGDRLILLTNRRAAGGTNFSLADWTQIAGNGSPGADTRALYKDITAGNVGDASAIVTSSGGYPASQCLIWRLSGCDLNVPPVANTTAMNSLGVGTINPAVLTGPNAGAVQRNLWFVYVGMPGQGSNDGLTPAVSVWPATYVNTGWSSTTVFGSNGVGQGWGSKIAVAGSDDPSAWTYQAGISPSQSYSFAINICNRGVQE